MRTCRRETKEQYTGFCIHSLETKEEKRQKQAILLEKQKRKIN